ncbi:hypothetical protein AWC19_13545 [Mycobacterium palustre]|uniref:SSD domain-containing protein n=1 Tax=Mycobacterium palustre TaxID=153971 RepID=A0A1X1ZFB5_9MYCO|nr:hypothetical protein AWC19_13545 [Mycobacterium palustre]
MPASGGALVRLTRLVLADPRRILEVVALITVAAGIFGFPVIDHLSSGGFEDPAAESSRAADLLTTKFGRGDLQMVLAVTSDQGALSTAAQSLGREIAYRLSTSEYVSGVVSAWTSPPPTAGGLISKDGKTGLVVAGIRGGGTEGQKHANELAAALVTTRDGVAVTAGGPAMTYAQLNRQSQSDLVTIETIAIPLCFGALVWVFGGLLAAALPLGVGIVAIIGVTALLRLITAATQVSTFALNFTIAMGLALAVDYTLLIVSRFRDELAGNDDRAHALMATMMTAGRTVLFSSLTVAMSMTALTLFPMYFMRSFAFAGVAVVALTATVSLVVTPAALAVYGDRLDSFDVRRLMWRLLRRGGPVAVPIERSFWYRTTKVVMRHAYSIGLPIVALLVVVGSPFIGVKWGFPDDRVLPKSTSARQVGDRLREGFAVNPMLDMAVVVPDVTGLTDDDLGRYAARVSTIPDVASVSSAEGTFARGQLIGQPSGPAGVKDGSAYFTLHSTAVSTAASDAQLQRLHETIGPGGRSALITGLAQVSRDTAGAIVSRVPLVFAVVAAVMFVLLLALTGSVVIPAKALLLNLLSLTAAFGALVWIFQDGHLGGVGTTTTGALVASIPVLLFCIAFGLSMDYEVFLMARIHEQWRASTRTKKDNDESIAVGLARTGRVVTAAALVMSISFVALSAAHVSIVRMIGLGLALAVIVDATLVRMCLVPAFMHILGAANWWAPRRWKRLLHRSVARGGPLPAEELNKDSRCDGIAFVERKARLAS